MTLRDIILAAATPAQLAALRPDLDEFTALSRAFRIRKPATTRAGLARGTGVGSCMLPLLGDGSAWFDRELTPQRGDLVLVECHDEWVARLRASISCASSDLREAFRQETMDGEPPRYVAKLYTVRDGKPRVVWNAGGVALERIGKVIGVARHIEVDGVPVYGSHDPRRLRRQLCSLGFGLAASLFLAHVFGGFAHG